MRGRRKFCLYYHRRYNIEIQVYILTEDDEYRGYYCAEYADQRFSCKTYKELEEVLEKKVTDSFAYEWKPVLYIKTSGEKKSMLSSM